MPTDLDLWTVPALPQDDTREIFEPVNAWPGASSRIYVNVCRAGPVAVYQYGYDPELGKGFMRVLAGPEQRWSEWFSQPEPAPPEPPPPEE